MKRFIAILSVMLCALFTLSAQPQQQQSRQRHPAEGGDRDGNFTEFQIQVLTKQLRLEGEKVEPFVKLYTTYSQSMDALRPEEHQPQRKEGQQGQQGERPTKPTDAEIEAQILKSFELAEKSTALKREYYPKFKEILTPRQILKMYNIERRLRERIVSESDRRSDTKK